MDGMQMDVLEKLPNESLCKCMPAWARYLCFALCFIVGFAMASTSLSRCDDKTLFFVFWCIGVPCAWLSTLFIKGVQQQIKHMVKSADNIVCNVVIVLGFVVVIVVECFVQSFWAVLVPYLLCFLALVWYSLSLIPGLQLCCKNCCRSCLACCK